MRGRVRGSGIVAVVALLTSCGPPPVAPQPDGGAGPSDAGVGAERDVADDQATVEAETAVAPIVGPADEPFHGLLSALASGSARAVRALVPSGGLLVLTSRVCRKPIYGLVNCVDERLEAERRRITDQVLAPVQDLFRRAREADDAFAPDALAIRCVEGGGQRWSCSTELPLGHDACRGDRRVPLRAVFVDAGDAWSLVELSFEEEILICD